MSDVVRMTQLLRMLVQERRDEGRLTESQAIELHRYINRAHDALKKETP